MSDTPNETPENTTDTPVDTPDTTDGDVLAAIDAAAEEVFADVPEDGVEGEPQADDDAAEQPDGDEGAPDISEPADDAEQADDGPSWDEVTETLIGIGMTAEDIRDLTPEAAAKIAARHIKPAEDSTDAEGADKDGDTDDAGEGEAEQVAETVEFDAEALAKVASESLIANKNFSEDEAADISGAITAVVTEAMKARMPAPEATGDTKQLTEKIGQLEQHIAQQRDYIAEQRANAHIDKLSDLYDGIKESGGRDKVMAKTVELVKKGIKFRSVEEAVDTAALQLFGASEKETIAKHKAKVNRHKKNGSPGTGKPVADDTVPSDPFEAAFNEAYAAQQK
ncbi:MAG: hypothetical protein ACX94C_07705 [Phycisphaerales bacterium]